MEAVEGFEPSTTSFPRKPSTFLRYTTIFLKGLALLVDIIYMSLVMSVKRYSY